MLCNTAIILGGFQEVYVGQSTLKIRIGDHEFESTGSSEIVQAQFEAFRELVAGLPAVTSLEPPQLDVPAPSAGTEELPLNKIMKNEGRIVSLTARGKSVSDEIILVLFGQKRLHANDEVTGAQIIDGLRQTRGNNIGRIDYKLNKMSNDGDTITIGAGRARKYRLTNQGVNRAKDLASELLKTVA